MPIDLDKREQQEALKEALKSWLNDQFAAFGRMTFWGLLSLAFAGAIYLALIGMHFVEPAARNGR